MRKLILATAVAVSAVPFAMPASADQGKQEWQERRECARELRNADSNREYRQEQRECAREISQARRNDWRNGRRYDWNRPAAGGYYYADQYYRDGRYYCRRSDGTTGLIIGAGVGALIGNQLDNGRSSLLGTLIGAAAGGAIGREIDRNDGRRDLRCR